LNNQKNTDFPILFVDDDPITLKFAQAFLQGWNVIYANSGEKALEIVKEKNIQIMVTDIKMPKMDGLTLLKKIKEINGTIQVIVITQTSEMDNLITALATGANDFLIKPMDKSSLEEALDNAFKKINRWKKAMRELFKKRQNS